MFCLQLQANNMNQHVSSCFYASDHVQPFVNLKLCPELCVFSFKNTHRGEILVGVLYFGSSAAQQAERFQLCQFLDLFVVKWVNNDSHVMKHSEIFNALIRETKVELNERED